MKRILSACALLTLVTAAAARADEGMWTFDNFPSAKVARTYGFAPTKAWLDHVRLASLRIAGGCSASFVSPQGLVMTNNHCVTDCVGALSTDQRDFSKTGFYAMRLEDEVKCPAYELDQLVAITDETAQVAKATAGKSGRAANDAMNAIRARLEGSCGSNPAVLCELVSLYHGGIYDLYRYKRYSDVRLAFAPEFDVGEFGGDPDNFNFPRYDFDLGLLRAYEDGKPASTPQYLRWSKSGAKAGDLTFASGNPGDTQRQRTVAQLAYERDHSFPLAIPQISEYRGVLEQYQKLGPEQLRQTKETLFFVENAYKEFFGEQQALLDARFFGQKVAAERRLRAAVAAQPKLQSTYAGAWDVIARVQPLKAALAPRYEIVAGRGLNSQLFDAAITLVRAAAERKKPNETRLPEFTDSSLVQVQEAISAPIPVYKAVEELNLTFSFTNMRAVLGADDPLVRKVIGRSSPEVLAHDLVAGTTLTDAAVRKALYDGGQAAIDASKDPLIRFAAALDPDFRQIRKEYEDRVQAPERAAGELVARALFAVEGTRVDPDATFTPRLNFGTVKGFDANGHFVPPFTTIGGLFDRATGYDPFALPKSWVDAKASLDPSLPMNFTTTNDIVGGNSGSPLVNRAAEVVGLVFDGNIYSLGGTFGFDPVLNRTVAVDSRAVLAGLRTVYHADRIVGEIAAANP